MNDSNIRNDLETIEKKRKSFLISNSYFLLSPSETDRFQFCGELLCLLGCEFDQRRPHPPHAGSSA